jgi:hypothetical protein
MGVGRRSISDTQQLQVYETSIPLGGDESFDTPVPGRIVPGSISLFGWTSHSSDQRIVNPINVTLEILNTALQYYQIAIRGMRHFRPSFEGIETRAFSIVPSVR